MIFRTDLHVLLGEIRQCICLFCGFVFMSQMVLLFNINILTEYILTARPNCAWHEKYIFTQESFYLQGILNEINEKDTSFLDCKHKHVMKAEIHLIMSESCTVCYLQKSMVLQAELISKGYHSLVAGLASFFRVPLIFIYKQNDDILGYRIT